MENKYFIYWDFPDGAQRTYLARAGSVLSLDMRWTTDMSNAILYSSREQANAHASDINRVKHFGSCDVGAAWVG